MWPFKPRAPQPPTIHDHSAWRAVDNNGQSLGRLMECTRCLIRWDAKYQKPACSCTLPRRIHPPAPSRNPIPQPDPERRSRPRGDRTSNQVPPYPLPASARPQDTRESAVAEWREWAFSEMYPAIERESYRLNTARDVAVATDTYWNEDMTTCPRGAKVQLLGAGGVAVYGNYHGDPFWECWAPVPRRRPR